MIHNRSKRVVKPWPKPNYHVTRRRRERLRELLTLLAIVWFAMAMLALIWFKTSPMGR